MTVHRCPNGKPHHTDPSRGCYVTCECRCQPCRDECSAYSRHRTRQTLYGRWQPYIDAAPVREHVAWLQSCGLGQNRIARLADISTGTMSKLIYGRRQRGMAPSKRVRRATADKILAVMPSQVAPGAKVDAAPARALVNVLVERGWTKAAIGKALGQDSGMLQLGKRYVTARNMRMLRRVVMRWPGEAPDWARRQPGGFAKRKAERERERERECDAA